MVSKGGGVLGGTGGVEVGGGSTLVRCVNW